jgi:hypothetical protein
MPSPFPGMDPFLEQESLWPWFQHQLVVTLQQMLSAAVSYRYSVHISQRRFHAGDQEHGEEYLEIHAHADGRLVTLLDIASPADKLAEAGRSAYQATRLAARQSATNIVEIDLILRGHPLLEYAREGLPSWDYAVTVTRATHPERYEIYTSVLDKRLPRFRLPLAAEGDRVVDLQDAFNRAYDDCDFGGRIDYHHDPGVPLSAEIRQRMTEIIRMRTG